MSHRLERLVQELGLGDPEVVWFGESEDWQRFEAPWYQRKFSAIEAVTCAEQKLRAVGPSHPDLVMVNGWELAIGITRRYPEAKVVVALDATPSSMMDLQRATQATTGRSLLRRAGSRLSLTYCDRMFATTCKSVSCWLPASAYVADTLVQRYGVDPGRTFVTRCPQESVAATSTRATGTPSGGRPRLLFVGNDFLRKGGAVLAQAYREYLRDECELVVVSNDPAAELIQREGAQLVSGLRDPAAVRPYYQSADLFVFPSEFETYGYVLCESLAQGLPFVATTLPSTTELVAESGGGRLVRHGATARELADAILDIVRRPEDLNSMRAAATSFAVSKLSQSRFLIDGAEFVGRWVNG